MKLRGLRQARQRRGISIGQLAETTGLRRETISHLEHGQEEPQPYALRRLVAALGVSHEELCGGLSPVALWDEASSTRLPVFAERH
jgi:transcriptional regulator with XRE-family HTH domain